MEDLNDLCEKFWILLESDFPLQTTSIIPWCELEIQLYISEFMHLSLPEQKKLYSNLPPSAHVFDLLQEVQKHKNYRYRMPYGLNLTRLYAIIDSVYQVYFITRITPDEDQHVYLGQVPGMNRHLIIKWTVDNTIEHEIKLCSRLHQLGAIIPAYFEGSTFWGQPVLIMEKFEPIDTTDDPYEIGVAILKTLKLFHPWGVHNDIKPNNIMKRILDGAGNPLPKPEYLLIDYGGATIKRKMYGYERTVWTKAWTSQVIETGQITTPKNDLLELGYVICGLLHQKKNPKLIINETVEIQREVPEDESRLGKYFARIRQMDERKLYTEEYDKLL